jgi:predicted dehydrogenase
MIKCGVIGLGKIGKVRIKAIEKNSNFLLTKIYDPKIQLENKKELCVETVQEIFESDLDAIFICAFNDVAAEYSIKAIQKGIHVFCEKPPARTVKELNLVKVTLDKHPNVLLKYGFNHRSHYSVIEAKKIIDSGKLGKLLWIRGVYGKAGSLDYHKNWRNYKKISGGGILIDQGIHMIDLMFHLSGQKFAVQHSLVSTLFWDIESEDNVFALLKSKNNVVASLHSSATQWRHKFLLEMCFENGYLNLDGILSGTRSYAPETIKYGNREFEDITHAMGKPQEKVIWFENDDSWEIEVNDFADAIISKTKIKTGTITNAMNALQCVEDIYNYGK